MEWEWNKVPDECKRCSNLQVFSLRMDGKHTYCCMKVHFSYTPSDGSCDKFIQRLNGKWVRLKGPWVTPGGEPLYVCSNCGGSEHLYGVEFPKRRTMCDDCGSINEEYDYFTTYTPKESAE